MRIFNVAYFSRRSIHHLSSIRVGKLCPLLMSLAVAVALPMTYSPVSVADDIGVSIPKSKHTRDIQSDRGRYVQTSPVRWHKIDANGQILEVLEELRRTLFIVDSTTPDQIYLRSEATGDRILFNLKSNIYEWTPFSDPRNPQRGNVTATKEGLEPQVVETFSNVDEVVSFQAGRFLYQNLGENRWSVTRLDGAGAAILHHVSSQHGSVIELEHYDDAAHASYNTTVDLAERRIWVAPANEAAKDRLKGLETGKFEMTNLAIRSGQQAGAVVTMSVRQALQKNAEVMLKFGSRYLYHEPNANSFTLRRFDTANAANFRFRFVPIDAKGTLVAEDKVIADAPENFVHIKSNSGAYLSVPESWQWHRPTISREGDPKNLRRSEAFKMAVDRDRSMIGLPGSQAVLVDDNGLSVMPTAPWGTNATFVIERPPTSKISAQIKADTNGAHQMQPQALVNNLQLEFVLKDGTRFSPRATGWTQESQAITTGGFVQFALEMPQLDGVAFGDIVRLVLTNNNPNDNIVLRSLVVRDFESFSCNCLVHPKTTAASNARVVTTDASKATFASAAFWIDSTGLQV